MAITRVVIPAGGIGTRLLPATKEQPKEMLPLFSPSQNGKLLLKPLVQLVFEQLYDVGIREFCFIVGRGKRVIEDHFTQDTNFLSHLKEKGKENSVADMRAFYKRLDDSNLVWVNQPRPLGFGDAVLKAKRAIGDDDFLVHAGDTYILSTANRHLKFPLEIFRKNGAEAVFVVKQMADVRERGVMEGRNNAPGIYRVRKVVEKPEHPKSNLGIEPVYVFRQSIFEALEKTKPSKSGEIQLTDAIQKIVASGRKVIAWRLNDVYLRLDIGNPESYWQALLHSYSSTFRKLTTYGRNGRG
jgi:UTP--glucose-1-phosphate uridylyltransferase